MQGLIEHEILDCKVQSISVSVHDIINTVTEYSSVWVTLKTDLFSKIVYNCFARNQNQPTVKVYEYLSWKFHLEQSKITRWYVFRITPSATIVSVNLIAFWAIEFATGPISVGHSNTWQGERCFQIDLTEASVNITVDIP